MYKLDLHAMALQHLAPPLLLGIPLLAKLNLSRNALQVHPHVHAWTFAANLNSAETPFDKLTVSLIRT